VSPFTVVRYCDSSHSPYCRVNPFLCKCATEIIDSVGLRMTPLESGTLLATIPLCRQIIVLQLDSFFRSVACLGQPLRHRVEFPNLARSLGGALSAVTAFASVIAGLFSPGMRWHPDRIAGWFARSVIWTADTIGIRRAPVYRLSDLLISLPARPCRLRPLPRADAAWWFFRRVPSQC